MEIEELEGFKLVACAFMKSGFEFIFEGIKKGENPIMLFNVFTPYDVSISSKSKVDVGEDFSEYMSSYLDLIVNSIFFYRNIEYPCIVFIFESGNEIAISACGDDFIGELLFITEINDEGFYNINV